MNPRAVLVVLTIIFAYLLMTAVYGDVWWWVDLIACDLLGQDQLAVCQ